MRYSQPLHPGMGVSVLARLRRMAPLPASGLVAGQAVASALDDLYGGGGGVYNDIDVFLRVRGTRRPAGSLVLLPQRYGDAVRVRPAPGADCSREYSLIPMQHTLVAAPTYRVAGVRRSGLLNEVFFTTSALLEPGALARCVLSSFDINAVRVAVDLVSGLLVWDSAFEQFNRTGELRLCALHTPYHSLLRLLRKAEELPRVSVQREASAAMVSLVGRSDIGPLLAKQGAAAFWFGEKYMDQARRFKRELAPYFTARAEWRYFDEQRGQARRGCGDETTGAWQLGTLVRRGEPDAACAALAGSALRDLLALPARVHRHFEGRVRSCVAMPAWQQKALAELVLAVQREYAGDDYLGQLASAAEARRLARQLRRRPFLSTRLLGLSASEQLAVLQAVDEKLVAAGVPDPEWVLERTFATSGGTDVASLLLACDTVLQAERKRRLGTLPGAAAPDAQLWQAYPDAQVTRLADERALREWCARHGLNCPVRELSGCWWLGIDLGRHGRDASLLGWRLDVATGLFSSRASSRQLRRRGYMPVTLQAAHRQLEVDLVNWARRAGYCAP